MTFTLRDATFCSSTLSLCGELLAGGKVLTIYLPRVLCLFVCDSVCVCVTIAERSAILLVLAIKLIKETRRRVWRGRDRGGEIGKVQIREGGCE